MKREKNQVSEQEESNCMLDLKNHYSPLVRIPKLLGKLTLGVLLLTAAVPSDRSLRTSNQYYLPAVYLEEPKRQIEIFSYQNFQIEKLM